MTIESGIIVTDVTTMNAIEYIASSSRVLIVPRNKNSMRLETTCTSNSVNRYIPPNRMSCGGIGGKAGPVAFVEIRQTSATRMAAATALAAKTPVIPNPAITKATATP